MSAAYGKGKHHVQYRAQKVSANTADLLHCMLAKKTAVVNNFLQVKQQQHCKNPVPSQYMPCFLS